jgi:predicted ATPase
MLTSVTITNFKKITWPGISLEKLAKVNYLVGENSSGKSSVLEYLFSRTLPETSFFLKDNLSAIDFWQQIDYASLSATISEAHWWQQIFLNFVKKRIVVLELISYLVHLQPNWESLGSGFWPKELFTQAQELLARIGVSLNSTNLYAYLDTSQLVGGESKLLSITLASLWLVYQNPQAQYLLLDEPEIHLHPSLQKKLPLLFHLLTNQWPLQLFVATHSPFLISAVAELTEQENQNCLKTYHSCSSQRVYFLKDGQLADKRGNFNPNGQKGYVGKEVSYIASRMLGVGLMDFISPQNRVVSPDAPILVLCEGESEVQDAKIYNIIFRNLTPRVLFVSCRGASQLHRTFRLLTEIKPGLSADFELLMLRDRDHEFPSLADIQRYQQENEGCRVLFKRALEVYLYNSETARLVLSKFRRRLPKLNRQRMDQLQQQVAQSVVEGIPGDTYKVELATLFCEITEGLCKHKKLKGATMAEKVAWLITPRTKTYQELYQAIFVKLSV